MVLDVTFIIAGTLIILMLIPLYIYREQIYSKFSKKGNIKTFIRDVDSYLCAHYPKISFNFDILEKLEDEQDIRRKEILIIEDLVGQFAYQEYELSTQKTVSKDKLWNGYDQNSILIKDNKRPIDWAQRKEAAWFREDGKCNRCGTKSGLVDSNALLAKQMKDGGGFNLENIVILCNDCTRVIKSSNLEKTKRDLHILDKLMRKVTN